MSKKEQLNRWAVHFKNLLNSPTPHKPQCIPAAETDQPIDSEKPTRTEIIYAIKKMKNGKASGPDEIPADVLKVNIDTTDMLLPLFKAF